MSTRLPEQKTADGHTITKGMQLWLCIPEDYPVYGPRVVNRPNDGNGRVKTGTSALYGYPSPRWCYLSKELALREGIRQTEEHLKRLRHELAEVTGTRR